MKWPVALTASFLLAGQVVSAGLTTRDIVHGIRRDDATDRVLRKRAESIVSGEYLEKRQTTTTMNQTTWDSETIAACTSALMNATNVDASGMAVCYNLPTLDASTGAFQADLRLFRVADATGQFAGLSNEGIQVGLAYNGASVQPVSAATGFTFKRDLHSLISWPSTRRGIALSGRAVTAPVLTQTYAFSGFVNKAAMTPNMNDAQFQAAVLPTVTLTAMTAAGAPAFNSTLNSTQAAFLVGALSGKAAVTTGGTTAAATAATATSTIFVLPGTKILIFPIGAIICGVWTLVGTVAVMYGTLGRIQFRDQYRRQTARAMAANISRI